MPQFIQLCLFLFEVCFLNKGLSVSLANVGFQRSERDSLVGRIVIDIFREKAGKLRADSKLEGKAESVLFTSACLRSILEAGIVMAKKSITDYYLTIGTERNDKATTHLRRNRRAKWLSLCYYYTLLFFCYNCNFKTLVNEPF